MLPSDVRMVATVHDELILDSPSAEAAQYSGMIQAIMEDAFKELFGPDLPIEVEAKGPLTPLHARHNGRFPRQPF